MITRTGFLALALLAPAVSWAQNDGAIATGRGASPPMTTEQKIDHILDGARREDAEARLVAPRRIHGEVGVAVGSDGYRAADVRVVAPIGEAGVVGLYYGQSKGGRRYDEAARILEGPAGGGFDVSRDAPVERGRAD